MDTCQNFGRGLLEQNVHAMLPSNLDCFIRVYLLIMNVLLECIIHLQNESLLGKF